ncbi:hypothetical protein ACFPRL_24940 [Pseudoclavibacter helvolus]
MPPLLGCFNGRSLGAVCSSRHWTWQALSDKARFALLSTASPASSADLREVSGPRYT